MVLDVTRTRSLRAKRMSTVEPCYWMLHVLDHSEQNVCQLWNHVTGCSNNRSLRAERMSIVEPCYWMLHVQDHSEQNVCLLWNHVTGCYTYYITQSRTYVYCGTMSLDVTRTRSLRAERMSNVEPCYWLIHVLDHSEQNVCLMWNHVTG